MAKKKTFEFDTGTKEFKIIAGIVLILLALVGISQIVTILMILFGAYLIYEGIKK